MRRQQLRTPRPPTIADLRLHWSHLRLRTSIQPGGLCSLQYRAARALPTPVSPHHMSEPAPVRKSQQTHRRDVRAQRSERGAGGGGAGARTHASPFAPAVTAAGSPKDGERRQPSAQQRLLRRLTSSGRRCALQKRSLPLPACPKMPRRGQPTCQHCGAAPVSSSCTGAPRARARIHTHTHPGMCITSRSTTACRPRRAQQCQGAHRVGGETHRSVRRLRLGAVDVPVLAAQVNPTL